MKVTPLQTLLGFKAIGLASELRDSDRRLACALLDHFNRRTGQCDPSLETLASLAGVNRRTVIRAVSRLVSVGFFRKVRHGGNFHRNHYEPVWSRFRQAEADWKRRRAARSGGSHRKNKSPLQCRLCPGASDNSATQTCGINLSDETSPARDPGTESPPLSGARGRRAAKGHNVAAIKASPPRFRVHSTSSRDAAREAAHRRWDTELLERFGQTPDRYAQLVEAIDLALASAATEAELKCRGSGARYVLEELDRRGLKLGRTSRSDDGREGNT